MKPRDGPVFQHAVEMLPLVRSMDDSRVVIAQQRPISILVDHRLAGMASWQNTPLVPDPNVTFNTLATPLERRGQRGRPNNWQCIPDRTASTAPSAGPRRQTGNYAVTATFHGHRPLVHHRRPCLRRRQGGRSIKVLPAPGQGLVQQTTSSLAAGSGRRVRRRSWDEWPWRRHNGVGGDDQAENGDTFTPTTIFRSEESQRSVGFWPVEAGGHARSSNLLTLCQWLLPRGRKDGPRTDRKPEQSRLPGWDDVMADGHPYQANAPHRRW